MSNKTVDEEVSDGCHDEKRKIDIEKSSAFFMNCNFKRYYRNSIKD